jgi:tetraacyldisaccharide-1-P 4'-kinase
MTEKDAVKCRNFSDHRLWCVKGNAVVDPDFFVMLLSAVSKVTIK